MDQTVEPAARAGRAICGAVACGVVVFDHRGEVTYANELARAWLGACLDPRQCAVGEDGSPLPGEAHPVALALRTGQPVRDVVLGISADPAERRWVRVSAVPARDPATGAVAEVVATLVDVTEQRRAEEQLRETNHHLQAALAELQASQRQIIQQERLRALGEMASGIAHDFNNALTQVQGYLELLLKVRPDDLYDPSKVRRYLTLMSTAAEDAADVVRRLREFYRVREEGEVFRAVDLNQVVQQAVALTQPRWKDQALARGLAIAIATDLAPLPAIRANESELREVLTNLIFNAAQAMPRGGTIAIRTRAAADQAILEVEDTGTGMTEEVRRRCMEPFFTTKGTLGSGLGLAMAYGIVQRHHGTIDVASAPGVGTTFTLRFPFHDDSPAAGTGPTADARIGPLRVLVVDDEPEICQIVAAYLEADGHAVVTAANGRDGLQKFLAGRFDLVITDRAMPELNGDALARAIKERAPGKPVVLLTGFGETMQAQGERVAGVDAVVAKPISVETLRRVIGALAPSTVPRT